jgi:hypothetical protein
VDSLSSDIGIHPATGNVTITSSNLTLNPFVGRRFLAGAVAMDALIGLDLAFSLAVREKANMVTPFEAYYQMKKQNHPIDLRPRVQVNAFCKHIGLSVAYSLGTRNLYAYDNPNYKNKKAYASFLRLGVSYRFK